MRCTDYAISSLNRSRSPVSGMPCRRCGNTTAKSNSGVVPPVQGRQIPLEYGTLCKIARIGPEIHSRPGRRREIPLRAPIVYEVRELLGCRQPKGGLSYMSVAWPDAARLFVLEDCRFCLHRGNDRRAVLVMRQAGVPSLRFELGGEWLAGWRKHPCCQRGRSRAIFLLIFEEIIRKIGL